MEITYPPKLKKSTNLQEEIKIKVEIRAQNNKWQEESGGLFGLKKIKFLWMRTKYLDRNRRYCPY